MIRWWRLWRLRRAVAELAGLNVILEYAEYDGHVPNGMARDARTRAVILMARIARIKTMFSTSSQVERRADELPRAVLLKKLPFAPRADQIQKPAPRPAGQ